MAKRWSITFKFPELPSPLLYQSAIVENDDAGVAVRRALSEVRKRKGVKGRRIKNFSVIVGEIDTVKENASAASD